LAENIPIRFYFHFQPAPGSMDEIQTKNPVFPLGYGFYWISLNYNLVAAQSTK